MAKQISSAGFDDKMIARQVALVNSMTRRERANPQILQASRKKRIASGSGLDVSELNKLVKMQRQMSDTMKKLGKSGGKGMMSQIMQMISGKTGNNLPSAKDISDIGKLSGDDLGGLLSKDLDTLPKGKLPFNLAGLGRKNK